MKTIEYMAAVKAALHIHSDYALAHKLGVTNQAVSRWRVGKSTAGDAQAPLIAQVLEIPVEKVLADLHAERERDPSLRRYWESIAQHFTRAALALVAVALFNITLAPRTYAESRPLENRNINSRTRKICMA